MGKAIIKYLIFIVLVISVALPTRAQPVFAKFDFSNYKSVSVTQDDGPGGQERSSPIKSGKGESCKTGKKGRGSTPTASGKGESLNSPPSPWGEEPARPQPNPEPFREVPSPQPGETVLELLLTVKVQPETPHVGLIRINPWPQIEEQATYQHEYRAFNSGIFKYITGRPLDMDLTALAIDKDWVFDHWEIKHWDPVRSEFSGKPAFSFTLRGATEAIAVFIRVYNLTVCCEKGGSVILTSIKSDTAFQVKPSQCGTGRVRKDSVVTLTPHPENGYVFDGWVVDLFGKDTEKQDKSLVLQPMNGDRKITAKFKPIVPPNQEKEIPPQPPSSNILRISVSPAVGGSVNPTTGPNGKAYAAGTSATITATPAEGYDFSDWSGDASGTGKSITVTMNSDKTVTANFKMKPQVVLYLLRININPMEAGSTNPVTGPLGKAFGAGMQVLVEAIPVEGYKFSHWSDDASGFTNPLSVIMDSNKTITANFVKITPVLPKPPPQY